MARSKNRNKQKKHPAPSPERQGNAISRPAGGGTPAASAPAPEAQEAIIAPVASAAPAPKGGNRQPQTGARQVGMGSCLLAVGVAFVLGLYLGSLLPGAFDEPKSMQGNVAAVGATQGQPAPAPEEKPALPQELADKIARLEQLLHNGNGTAGQWTELGNACFDAGLPAKAIAAYRRSLELAPGNPDVLTDMGIMYREQGSFVDALESFRKALAINPKHEHALFNEGVVLHYDLQRTEEAIAAWQRLLAVNPNAKTPDGRPVTEAIRHLH